MRNPAKPYLKLSQNPANSDVTLDDIYFNLLEFWTPRHCERSGAFCTSLKNAKKNMFLWLTRFFTGSSILCHKVCFRRLTQSSKVGDVHLQPTSRVVTFSVTTRPKREQNHLRHEL
jgi:hypothetical protein